MDRKRTQHICERCGKAFERINAGAMLSEKELAEKEDLYSRPSADDIRMNYFLNWAKDHHNVCAECFHIEKEAESRRIYDELDAEYHFPELTVFSEEERYVLLLANYIRRIYIVKYADRIKYIFGLKSSENCEQPEEKTPNKRITREEAIECLRRIGCHREWLCFTTSDAHEIIDKIPHE